MPAPNIVNISSLIGKTTYVNLNTTGSTSIISNPNGSGRVYKINNLLVSNTNSASLININYYDSSSITLASTSGSLAGSITVPLRSNLTILDKNTSIYLEENKSIGATTNSASYLTVVCSYEDIS